MLAKLPETGDKEMDKEVTKLAKRIKDELPDLDAHPRAAEAKALQAITGQKFGTDADKWQAWWKTQQGKP